jgi:hypothetical protein
MGKGFPRGPDIVLGSEPLHKACTGYTAQSRFREPLREAHTGHMAQSRKGRVFRGVVKPWAGGSMGKGFPRGPRYK